MGKTISTRPQIWTTKITHQFICISSPFAYAPVRDGTGRRGRKLRFSPLPTPTLTAARAAAGFDPATGDEGIGQRRPPPLLIVPAARTAVKVKLPHAAVAAWYVLQQVTRLRAQRVSSTLADFLIKCAKNIDMTHLPACLTCAGRRDRIHRYGKRQQRTAWIRESSSDT